jgi:quercetin dioxygenase-like cupin family protein
MSRFAKIALAAALFAASPAIAQNAVPKPPIPAPGQGIIPLVSGHTSAMPMLYQLDKQPIEKVSPLISRQFLTGAQSTFVKWTVKKGGTFPLHHHAAEQVTWITSGRCEVTSNGNEYVMNAGDVMIIPPNVPHEFVCTEDSIDIDFFSPQRQDWLDGTADYLSQGKAK